MFFSTVTNAALRLLLFSILLAAPDGLRAADFYASPQGTGDGTLHDPWPLNRALQLTNSIKPGDQLWLLGGHYIGPFVSKLTGTAEQPIAIRSLPQQQVTLDGGTNDSKSYPLTIEGGWVVFRDLEIIHSATWKEGAATPVAVQCKAPSIKLVNLVIHDAGQGIGAWMEAVGLEVFGCLIYHHGQRALEHGIYTQNNAATGTKTIHDNIIFNNAGFGIHAYTQQGQLSGFDFQGNVIFNNGSKQGDDTRYDCLFVGGEPAADRIVAVSNYTFFSEGVSRPNMRFSVGDHQKNPHGELRASDNYIVGGIGFTAEDWRQVVFTNNIVVNWAARLAQARLPFGTSWSAYTWDFNHYHGPAVFGLGDQLYWNLNDWRRVTSCDRQSRHATSLPSRNAVFVRGNRYQSDRGHVVIYNWEKRPRVSANLSPILQPGQKFEIRNAQDYFGEPIVSGVFDGQPVMFPTTNLVAAVPRSGPKSKASTGSLFNVYVIIGK